MTEAVEDVGTNALEPVNVPVVAEAPISEAAAAPEPEILENSKDDDSGQDDLSPKVHGLKGRTPWYMERINEETNKRREIESQLAQERREKQEAKALLERMQGGDKNQPKARTEDTDIDALVDARAEQKLFNADCNAVAERGQLEIPDFNDKLGLLRSIGVVNDEFLKDVFAVDKVDAHKILDRLAQEPEKANLMVRMDSRRRIAELTRMNMTEAVKPAPVAVPRSGVSKVPPPKPVVDAIADNLGETDLTNDKLDDRTWSKLWDKKYRKTA